MRRSVPLVLTLLALALPSAAVAQSAGDEQYSDPFGQVDQPSDSPDQGTQEQAPAPAQSDQTVSATQTQAVQQTDAPTLPATGLPAGLLAGTGALLLAAERLSLIHI